MRHSSKDYELIDKTALRLRTDYGFLSKSIDIFELARKLNIIVTPYSKLTDEQLLYINNTYGLEDGFTVIRSENGILKFYTFYNDAVSGYRQRFTIAHEIKHVVFMENNPNEKEEDLANHFARYILAPTCMVMNYVKESPYVIASLFDISIEAANNALMAANNRIAYGHEKLADFEIIFIKEVQKKIKPESLQ